MPTHPTSSLPQLEEFLIAAHDYWNGYANINSIAMTAKHSELTPEHARAFKNLHINVVIAYTNLVSQLNNKVGQHRGMILVVEQFMNDIRKSNQWVQDWLEEPTPYYDSATYPTRM